MNPSLVSVIVPAYNCEQTIDKTINAILNQTHSTIELIVVDDGSVDQTKDKIKNFKNVCYVYQNNAGPATARNIGVQKAKGEFLFFTDSDCVPNKDWIEQALKIFLEKDIAVVAGTYAIANNDSLLARCIQKEIEYRHKHLMTEYPKAFGSYNFGVRKKIFDEVNGFEQSYRYASGEDNDLSYKIVRKGYKIYFSPKVVVAHHHTTQLLKYLKEQYRHGFWRVKMYVDHPHMAKGDNYTFWKDIVEVPLVFGVVLSFVLSFFVSWFGLLMLGFIGVLFIIQLCYSYVTQKNIFEAIYLSFVTFFRSFARTFGFSSGILHFFAIKKIKKSN